MCYTHMYILQSPMEIIFIRIQGVGGRFRVMAFKLTFRRYGRAVVATAAVESSACFEEVISWLLGGSIIHDYHVAKYINLLLYSWETSFSCNWNARHVKCVPRLLWPCTLQQTSVAEQLIWSIYSTVDNSYQRSVLINSFLKGVKYVWYKLRLALMNFLVWSLLSLDLWQ